MSFANIVQTNFTAGEVSPRMLGRVDVERYKNGVQEMENCLPLIHGGAKSTGMLRYNGDAKNANRTARLVRFEFSKTEANVLEFGHQYMRVFNADRTQVMDGGSPYEITTVYDESELFEIEYIGGADTIFLFHESHPVQRLRRFANDNWVIEDAPFSPAPFTEQGLKPSATLTLSAATVGTGRTATAGSASFLAADVGRRITFNGGTALITAYSSTTVVTVTIENAFESTSIAADAWTINGSPQAVCNPSSNANVGATINLTLSTGAIYDDPFSISNSGYDGGASPPEFQFATTSSNGYNIGDIVEIYGCVPFAWNGTYEIVGLVDALPNGDDFQVNGAPGPGAMTKKGSVRKITVSSTVAGWRAGDVGSFVSINGGLIEITSYSSSSVVSGIVRQKMTSDAGAQKGAWSLQQSMWSSVLGYPRTGAFFQQRLVCGGSTAYPHTVWASVTGEYLNFEIGTDDDEAFIYDIDATEFDPILHLATIKNKLIALTSGKEFTLTGGVESPMTPTNVQVENPTDYGCNDVRPVRVENELLYLNRVGKKLRAMGYRFDNDSFSSPDLTKLSEHITGDGIVDMAYQQEPESIVWMVRSDGTMVTCAIDREEGVLAFARQVTDGFFESVTAIPNGDGVDEVWCVVRRTVGGSTVRYIESFDSSVDYGLHSAITGTFAPADDTIAGLDHLEGETVDVIADGVVMSTAVVSSGQITLTRTCDAYSVGLPSRGYIKTLNPEIVTQMGSAQGNNVKLGRITLRVLDTVCINIAGQYIDLRKFGSSLLDQAAPAFTGDVDVSKLGWAKNGYIELEQANALPFHVLAIIIRMTVNNG